VTFNAVKLLFIAFLKLHACNQDGVSCLSESHCTAFIY